MLSVAQVSYNQFKNGVKEGGVIVVEPNLVTPTEEDRKNGKSMRFQLLLLQKKK